MSDTSFDTLLPALEQRIAAGMAQYHIPGVAVGLLWGEQTYAAGFGVTSLENPLPVTDTTLFQIGSITKTITALAVMRLVEAGQIDLDAPLRTYLPDLRLADEAVLQQASLRHVFTHTGGWLGDYFDDCGPGDDALARIVACLANLPQEMPLGEIWSYNNAGFYIAGRILEVITGKSYEAAVQSLVLLPLGMAHSFFWPGEVLTERFAVGHDAVFPGEAREPKVQRPWALARSGHAVGGLAAPMQDLLRYARFQMGDGAVPDGAPEARLLSPALLAEMHNPRVPAANGEWVGVSWFMRQAGELRLLRHGGATNGQMATLIVVPQARFAFIVLTNSDRGDELYQPLTRWVLESCLGIPDAEPVALPVTYPDAQPYLGQYDAAANRCSLVWRDEALWLEMLPKGGFPSSDSPPPPAPPPVRVALCGKDQIVILDEPGQGQRGEFLRTADGTLAWLRLSGRAHRRLA